MTEKLTKLEKLEELVNEQQLVIKYLKFDLEVTQRERNYYKKLSEEKT